MNPHQRCLQAKVKYRNEPKTGNAKELRPKYEIYYLISNLSAVPKLLESFLIMLHESDSLIIESTVFHLLFFVEYRRNAGLLREGGVLPGGSF